MPDQLFHQFLIISLFQNMHMIKLLKKVFSQNITKDQYKDAGMAFTLIFILLKVIFEGEYFLMIAMGLLILTMTAPIICKPLAVIWFGLAQILSTIVSKIILSVVFFVIVTPVAFIQRLMRKDSLRLNDFKKGRESVMYNRNHTFGPQDIEKPF